MILFYYMEVFIMNINYKKIFFYNLPASITIEASFIYPIIIFIIALIITLSFYLHDKIVSNSLSYRDCIYASINYNDKSTSDFTNSNFLETTINSYVLMYKNSTPAIEANYNSIKIITDYLNNKTAHTYSNFLHCNKIRRYSIIFKQIKEDS